MTAVPVKPTISIDVLNQFDIRVGTVTSVDDIPGADKLVKLVVSFGDHTRTIVAGLKQERADPREITGKQALFVINLAPRRMYGVTSGGMLLDIGCADGVRAG
jgi:tRNA-binding protein